MYESQAGEARCMHKWTHTCTHMIHTHIYDTDTTYYRYTQHTCIHDIQTPTHKAFVQVHTYTYTDTYI